MIDQVRRGIESSGPEPIVLMGSSLGAFVAVQTALKYSDRVNRMVLLAPALDFGGKRLENLGDRGIDEWQRTKRLDVFHYGFGRTMPVHYELYADACRYDCLQAELPMPIQVFQGRRDTAVDPEMVEQWAGTRPNVELQMLDDDHQLLGSLEYIWTETKRFLNV
jgi:hypothetical protein